MIPKTIHYCWFGGKPLPQLAQKCIASWKKYCPDYEIIEWNESNYDISKAPLYVRQAYEMKKWAFVSDYVRLQVVYENGGIYFDTDVELIKPLDDLLKYDGFFGFERGKWINTGLGFGAKQGLPVLRDVMCDYATISFIQDNGDMDLTSCPVRNTEAFFKYGLRQNNKKQVLNGNIIVLPSDYMNPVDFETGNLRKTGDTISIHWYAASWFSEENLANCEPRKRQIIREKRRKIKEWIIYLPNRLGLRFLGKERYDFLKKRLGK